MCSLAKFELANRSVRKPVQGRTYARIRRDINVVWFCSCGRFQTWRSTSQQGSKPGSCSHFGPVGAICWFAWSNWPANAWIMASFATGITVRITGRALRTTATRFSAAIKTRRAISYIGCRSKVAWQGIFLGWFVSNICRGRGQRSRSADRDSLTLGMILTVSEFIRLNKGKIVFF